MENSRIINTQIEKSPADNDIASSLNYQQFFEMRTPSFDNESSRIQNSQLNSTSDTDSLNCCQLCDSDHSKVSSNVNQSQSSPIINCWKLFRIPGHTSTTIFPTAAATRNSRRNSPTLFTSRSKAANLNLRWKTSLRVIHHVRSLKPQINRFKLTKIFSFRLFRGRFRRCWPISALLHKSDFPANNLSASKSKRSISHESNLLGTFDAPVLRQLHSATASCAFLLHSNCYAAKWDFARDGKFWCELLWLTGRR